MQASGHLQKMLILAFSDSEKCESGLDSEAQARFEVLINPESYTHTTKIKYADSSQGTGTSGQQLKYEATEPAEMSFEFLFDNTGIIDGKPRESIVEDVEKFRQTVLQYHSDSHEPLHLKLVWGQNLIFKGRLTEASITYKLFKPDGTPIRAVAKINVKASVEENRRVAEQNNRSPDLTHIRTVKAGDTLPLMCHQIYGNSAYYLAVAAANGLDNLRKLTPGMKLRFPPLSKSS
ncbi:MAG: LysM peptidoglycan-binding domain-containing protein [Candidatus Kapabacteria bacterium]|nr:LysM peptidoglycan-binding domain-containing protein [Candidatus Kapabacteria bacterium]